MQQGAYLIRDKILRRLALSYPPLALEATFCFNCHNLQTKNVQWRCGPNSKCVIFQYASGVQGSRSKWTPLPAPGQRSLDCLYWEEPKHQPGCLGKEKQVCSALVHFPPLNWNMAAARAQACSTWNTSFPAHGPCDTRSPGKSVGLKSGNWCVNTEQLSYRPSFRSKHAHAAGFHSFFGLNLGADAPFWDSGKYLHFYDAASVLCVNGRVTASLWSSPTTAG